MKRPLAALLLALGLLGVAGCGQAQEGPQGVPTPPDLQTPVPDQPGQPPPTVIPMPPDQPGTLPPGDEEPTLVAPTVQP
jgi:hypothetical protein